MCGVGVVVPVPGLAPASAESPGWDVPPLLPPLLAPLEDPPEAGPDEASSPADSALPPELLELALRPEPGPSPPPGCPAFPHAAAVRPQAADSPASESQTFHRRVMGPPDSRFRSAGSASWTPRCTPQG